MNPETQSDRISRRSFINYLLGGGLVATTISSLYPLIGFVMPPRIREVVKSSVAAGKVKDLSPNSGRIFRFGDKPGILIKAPSGELKAFSAVCTHLACIVQYREDLGHIWCACHNGHYDLNGKVISGPPPKPLEEYQVNVAGEEIVVSKGG